MKIYIKSMVSLRCKMLVKDELTNLGLHCVSVELGMVEIHEEIQSIQLLHLNENLLKAGLEVLDDKRSILVERIKVLVIEMVHYSDEIPKGNFSQYIAEKLDHKYTYLSHLFAEVNGITIGKFIGKHKIEKVKELLLYDELNISEISYKMNYSSVAHLSNQFKKATGLTPSHFKELKKQRELSLEFV